jgi:hypothetical protein
MKKFIPILIVVAFFACNNETTTEANKSDSSAMNTVDSVKQEMNTTSDSLQRISDSITMRKN